MSSQEVETIGSKTDTALVAAAAIVVLAGVVGFSFFSDQPLIVRIGILLGGIVGGIALAWFSAPGKRLIIFAGEAYDETKRVTWPTRKETLTTTGVVFAFVFAMGIFLFAIDKSVEWVLYDLILRWKQ